MPAERIVFRRMTQFHVGVLLDLAHCLARIRRLDDDGRLALQLSEDAAHRFADQDMIIDDENLHPGRLARGTAECQAGLETRDTADLFAAANPSCGGEVCATRQIVIDFDSITPRPA